MKKFLIVGVSALALVACSQIDSGNVGVESTFGQVKDQPLPPGVYNTIFKSVMEVSAKETPIELNELKPKTKDNVTLADMDLTVYYKINAQAAPKIFMRYAGDIAYLPNGDAILGSNLITRTAREAVYRAAAQYSSYDIHTKRTEIAADVMDFVKKDIQAANGDWFEITNVIVRNITTDARLEEAIKDAAQVEFQIRKKNQELELAKTESERKRIEAEGEARANRIIAESLTPNLIELRRIEAMHSFAGNGTHTVILGQGTNANPLISTGK